MIGRYRIGFFLASVTHLEILHSFGLSMLSDEKMVAY